MRKPSIILVAGSVSKSITPAESPPVVITPLASKNDSVYGAPVTDARWAPAAAAIIGNSATMISVLTTSFLASGAIVLRAEERKKFKRLRRARSRNIFMPPAVENPQPPANISTTSTPYAAPLSPDMFSCCSPAVVLAETA